MILDETEEFLRGLLILIRQQGLDHSFWKIKDFGAYCYQREIDQCYFK
jgi:hypothetical protein